MFRRLASLLAAALLAVFVGFAAVGATAHDTPKPRPVYLSLGTSLAAGTFADANGDSVPFSRRSYTDQLYTRLRGRIAPKLEHVKLGCPGETALTFGAGGICDEGGPLAIYDKPQLAEALEVIATRDVKLITIDLGANDLIDASDDLLACSQLPTPQEQQACTAAILQNIAGSILGVVAPIRAAAGPDVPIIAMNYYNPNLAAWLGYFSGVPAGLLPPDPAFAQLSASVSQGFNDALGSVYALPTVDFAVADVASGFRSNDFADRDGDGAPNNVEVVCRLTSMCPDAGVQSNIHPTRIGYKRIAKTFRNEVTSFL
jgi:hypothetical protein